MRSDLFYFHRDDGPGAGPARMQALHQVIRNCPEPYEHPQAGHFVQKWGEEVAAKALAIFDQKGRAGG